MKQESSNSFLEYREGIMFVKIKEGAEICVDNMKEQYDVQARMVKNDKYAVLVDGSGHVTVTEEARKLMASYSPPNRKATAIISNNNLATTILINFYLKVNKPKVKTRFFKNEEKALKWLRECLN